MTPPRRTFERAKHDVEDSVRDLYRLVWNTIGTAHLAKTTVELRAQLDVALEGLRKAAGELDEIRSELP